MAGTSNFRTLRQFAAVLLALALLPATIGRAADEKPKLSPALLDQLEAAQTSAEQDRVLHSIQPALSPGAVRTQLLARAYQLTLEGDYLRARADNNLVLRLAAAAGAGGDAAAAQVQIAFALREAGDFAGARTVIEKARAWFEAHSDEKRGLISVYQASGIIYLYESDFVRALQSLHRALSLSEEIHYREGIIPALNSIGEVYRTQGQPERALEFYERARQAVGDDEAWNMAFIFNNIGMSYEAMDDLQHAVENIGRARAVAERVGFRPRVETSLAVLGDLELERGRLDEAAENYGQSLKLARELQHVSGEARAILGHAHVARARGDQEEALGMAKQAAELSRGIGQVDQVVPALTLSGRCLQELKRNAEAARAFEVAIAAVEELRNRVAGGEVEREAFFAAEIEPYDRLVGLLVRQKKPEQALGIAERASARVLLDIANAGRAELASVLTPQEEIRQQELDLNLADANRALGRLSSAAAKPEETALAQAESALHRAQSARDNFEALIDSEHAELRRTAPPEPLGSVVDLAPLLRGGKSALLRFVVTEEESFLFLATLPAGQQEPRLKVISLGKNRAEIARLTKNFRDRLAARSLAWEKSARDLYDLLLRPVADDLRGLDSLVVVPEGPLWDLPFQALESGADRPLLVDYSVRYAPSLTLFRRLEKASDTAAPEISLLAFLNPALEKKKPSEKVTRVALMDSTWQSLEQVEKQVPELEKIYPPPGGEFFVGSQAREKTFKEKAAGAGILHFATHGVLDDRAPLYSYLLFSQVDVAPGEDGRLEARELMRLKLRARLAILCGCETARGQATAGEGVIGLSWGFMVAGCPATIVSQWKVDSASSTPLMVDLHRQLHAGMDNAEALRLASLELRKDPRYRHPFYWAPFVLVGR